MPLGLYEPPDWERGRQLSGADVNTFLDGIATATTGIDKDRISPRGRWGRELFVDDAAPEEFPVHGYYWDGSSALPVEWRLKAEADGILLAISTFWGAITVERDDVVLGIGAAIEKDDELVITVTAGGLGCVRLRWDVVA